MNQISTCMNQPEISRMLTLSTAHITEKQAAQWGSLDPFQTRYNVHHKGEYGWFLYVNPDLVGDTTLPKCVQNIMRYADQEGCDWIMLDRDGPVMPDLPTYDW